MLPRYRAQVGMVEKARAKRARARQEMGKDGGITGSRQANQLEKVSISGVTTTITRHGAGRIGSLTIRGTEIMEQVAI